MREIAYTALGRNALAAGLICHGAAIILGMTSASGADIFFKAVYLFSCHALGAGAFVELRHRGIRPWNTWRFYLILSLTVLPVLGPLVLLGLIYSLPREGQQEQRNWTDLFPAILKLRANVMMVFALIILLFLLFAVLHSRHDPYFKRRTPGNRSEQSVSNTGQPEINARIVILKKGEELC
jgi:hypothetical protein